MFLNYGDNAPNFKGYEPYQSPTAIATSTTISSGGILGNFVINDSQVYGTTAYNLINNNNVYCSQPVVNLVNQTPTICDITNYPNITTLQNGDGRVVITTAKDSLLLNINCKKINNSEIPQYVTGYQDTSLTKLINNLIVEAVGSYTTPSPSFMNVYSSGYTLNTNLYTKNIIDLSPFTENGYAYTCSLISPRHIVFPTHAAPDVGTSITFTRADGSTTTKTITVVGRNINGLANSDLGVGYLDSNVTGIIPYSVLPLGNETKIKIPLGLSNDYYPMPLGIYAFTAKIRFPFGGGDYIRQMQLGIVQYISGNYGALYNGAGKITNSNDIRYSYANWISRIFVNDSGSPTFLPTGLKTSNGTPLTLLLGTQYAINNVSNISNWIPQVNQAMNAMKDSGDTTVYALDVANTSNNVCYTKDGFATTLSTWWNSFYSY